MRTKSEAGNQQKSEAGTWGQGGEGCSHRIAKGHFEDRIIATSVKNGLGLAGLALGPGGGLGDILSLFSSTLQLEMERKATLIYYFPVDFLSLFLHYPPVPGNEILKYTNVLLEVSCHSPHQKFMVSMKLAGP